MTYLTGKLLIAMPGMGDSRFAQAVIYLCQHDDSGAMGLIVNKPAPELSFEGLLVQLKVDLPEVLPEMPIHLGGPVDHARGFVLHSADYDTNSSTTRVDGLFGLTATRDVLEDIATGAGPRAALLALGYSGWGPGQLESEIARNGWLTAEASPEIVFDRMDAKKWQGALGSLGIDPVMLSPASGRA